MRQCEALTTKGKRCRCEAVAYLKHEGREVQVCSRHHRAARDGRLRVEPLRLPVEENRPRRPQVGDDVINAAMAVLEERMAYRSRNKGEGDAIGSPDDARKYFRLRLAEEEREVFAVMFLDNRHRIIETESLFLGSVSHSEVTPREVVKRALYHNASAVIVAHNHPSGVAEPSEGDAGVTRRLQGALSLVDVRVLDHLVVGADSVSSLAERQMM